MVRIPNPGEVYADDEFVFWEFGGEALARLGRHAGFAGFELIDDDEPQIAGHPQLLGQLI